MPQASFDIAILGGGPAGVVLCRELRRMGHDVALISAPRHFDAFEGFAERAIKGLSYAGCEQALAAIGPEVQRSAYWNGEHFGGNRERIADRTRFDLALLEDARSSGAAVFEGRVGRCEPHDDGWLIHWRDGTDHQHRLHAGYLADARGRRAPRSGVDWQRGPATVCIARRWRYAEPQPATARVETFEDGWMWFARDACGEAMMQFFLSIEQQPLPAGDALLDHYQSLLDQQPLSGELLEGAVPVGGIHVRDAGMSLCSDPFGPRSGRVAEAALSVDPLAGHGVFEAVGLALAFAACLNTMLRRPDNEALAKCYYSDRLQHDFLRMGRTGRDFYRLEQRWPESPYWHERSHWPDDLPSHPGMSGTASVEQKPVMVDDLIELREVLVTPDQPRGIWQIAGVPLVPLLRRMREGREPGESIFDGAAPGGDIATAVAWLRHRGLLPDAVCTG